MSVPSRDTHALIAFVSASGLLRFFQVERAVITPVHVLWLDMLSMDGAGLWAMHAHLFTQAAPAKEMLPLSKQTLTRIQAEHADFHPDVLPTLLNSVPERLFLEFVCSSADPRFVQTITRLATLRVYYVIDRRTWSGYLSSAIFSTPQTP